jgi:hypothetical protein
MNCSTCKRQLYIFQMETNSLCDTPTNILTDTSTNILTDTSTNILTDTSTNILTDTSTNNLTDTSTNTSNNIAIDASFAGSSTYTSAVNPTYTSTDTSFYLDPSFFSTGRCLVCKNCGIKPKNDFEKFENYPKMSFLQTLSIIGYKKFKKVMEKLYFFNCHQHQQLKDNFENNSIHLKVSLPLFQSHVANNKQFEILFDELFKNQGQGKFKIEKLKDLEELGEKKKYSEDCLLKCFTNIKGITIQKCNKENCDGYQVIMSSEENIPVQEEEKHEKKEVEKISGAVCVQRFQCQFGCDNNDDETTDSEKDNDKHEETNFTFVSCPCCFQNVNITEDENQLFCANCNYLFFKSDFSKVPGGTVVHNEQAKRFIQKNISNDDFILFQANLEYFNTIHKYLVSQSEIFLSSFFYDLFCLIKDCSSHAKILYKTEKNEAGTLHPYYTILKVLNGDCSLEDYFTKAFLDKIQADLCIFYKNLVLDLLLDMKYLINYIQFANINENITKVVYGWCIKVCEILETKYVMYAEYVFINKKHNFYDFMPFHFKDSKNLKGFTKKLLDMSSNGLYKRKIISENNANKLFLNNCKSKGKSHMREFIDESEIWTNMEEVSNPYYEDGE